VRRQLWAVGLRSFFVQACWTFESMQSLGFAWCMLPALKKLYPGKEERKAALKRHLEIFNTHPYMAPLVMGSLIRTEEEGLKSGDPGLPERLQALKQGLNPPLAAIGDALFWATLRPLAGLSAVALAWMAPEFGPLAPLWVYAGLFNLPHLMIRFSGLFQGYALGGVITEYLRKADTQGVIAAFRLAAMVLLGAALAAFGAFKQPASGAPMPFRDNFLFIAAGLAMLMALRLKFSVNKVFAASCLAALLFSVVFPNSH
jgi:mannose/fructose/N-acetylgalactosamine-specific phosphotransferase system component IID